MGVREAHDAWASVDSVLADEGDTSSLGMLTISRPVRGELLEEFHLERGANKQISLSASFSPSFWDDLSLRKAIKRLPSLRGT